MIVKRVGIINWITFLTYVIVITFSPGPNNITSMVYGSKYKIKIVMNYIIGIWVGFFLVMLATGVFNLVLIDLFPNIEKYLGYIGSIYLSFLAVNMLFSNPEESQIDSLVTTKLVAIGMSIQLINPKVIMYGMLAMSSFILPVYNNFLQMTLFSILLASTAFISCSVWALFGNFFSKYLKRNELLFKVIVSSLLFYCAYMIIR